MKKQVLLFIVSFISFMGFGQIPLNQNVTQYGRNLNVNEYKRCFIVSQDIRYCGLSDCPYNKTETVEWGNSPIQSNTWYKSDNNIVEDVFLSIAYRKINMDCPEVHGDFVASYLASDLNLGMNSYNYSCDEQGPDTKGSVSIAVLPLISQPTGWYIPPNCNSGSTINLNITTNDVEGDLVILKKNGNGAWETYNDFYYNNAQGSYFMNVPEINVPSDSIEFRLKSKKNGYYSSNCLLLNLFIKYAPEIEMPKTTFYRCENDEIPIELIVHECLSNFKLFCGTEDEKWVKPNTINGLSSPYLDGDTIYYREFPIILNLSDYFSIQSGDDSVVVQAQSSVNLGDAKIYFTVNQYSSINYDLSDPGFKCPGENRSVSIINIAPVNSTIYFKLDGQSWSTNPYLGSLTTEKEYLLKTAYKIGNEYLVCMSGSMGADRLYFEPAYKMKPVISNIADKDSCDGTNLNVNLEVEADTVDNVYFTYKKWAWSDDQKEENNTDTEIILPEGNWEFQAYYKEGNTELCKSEIVQRKLSNNYQPLSFIDSTILPVRYCESKNNGSFSVQVDGGWFNNNNMFTPTYTYILNKEGAIEELIPNTQSSTYSNQSLSMGNYVLGVQDFKGCQIEKTFSIGLTNTFVLDTITHTNVNYCQSNNDGTISITVHGGKTPYQLTLNQGNYAFSQSNYSLQNLPVNDYSITLQDNAGCEILPIENVEIRLENKLKIRYFSVSHITGCSNNQDGEFTVFTGGGELPFNYYLYSVATQQIIDSAINISSRSYTFQNLSAGGYYASVYDHSGCHYKRANSKNIGVSPFSANVIGVKHVKGCDGDIPGEVSFTVDGSIGKAYTIELIEGASNVIKSQNRTIYWYNIDDTLSFSVENPGTYHLKIINNNCDAITNSFAIENNSGFTAFNVNHISGCEGNNLGSVRFEFSGQAHGPVPVQNNYLITEGQDTLVQGQLLLSLDGSYSIQSIPACQQALLTVNINGCQASKTFTVKNKTIPYDFEATELLCDAHQKGTIVFDTASLIKYSSRRDNYVFAIKGVSYKDWLRDSNFVFTNLDTGAYQLMVREKIRDCFSEIKSVEIKPIEPLTWHLASPGKQNLTFPVNLPCFADSINILTNVTGGGGDLSFLHNGDTLLPEWFGANSHNLIVIDSVGCSSDTTFVVSTPDELGIELDTTIAARCSDQPNGEVLGTLHGGVPGYTFYYQNNSSVASFNGSAFIKDTNFHLNNLLTGSYDAYVTDNNNCISDSIGFAISAEAAPAISVSNISTPSCKDGSDGSITIQTTQDGFNSFQYQIDNGAWATDDTEHTFPNLSVKSYTIKVKDSINNCPGSQVATVNAPGPQLIPYISPHHVTKASKNDGWFNVSASGGKGNYFFSLYDSNDNLIETLNNSYNATFDDLSFGEYSLYVEDSMGCVKSVSDTIKKPAIPLILTVLSSHVTCFGGNDGWVACSAQNGWQGGYTYNLTDSMMIYRSDTNIFEDLPHGTYYIRATDIGGGTVDTVITINEPPALIGSPTLMNHVSCKNQSNGVFELAINGGVAPYTVELDGVNQNDSLMFTGKTAGLYYVDITDAHGCTYADSIFIEEPQFELHGEHEVNFYNGFNIPCAGITDTIKLRASGGTPPYSVSFNNNSNQSLFCSGNWQSFLRQAGSYAIQFSDDNGCVYNLPDTLTLSEPPPLSFTAEVASDPSCFGESNGRIEKQIAGGVDSQNYMLDLSGYYESGVYFNHPDIILNSNIVMDTLAAGIYHLHFSDANNCTLDDTVIMSQPQELISVIDDLSHPECHGASTGALSILNHGGITPYTYSLNGGAENSCSGSLTINQLMAGSYEIVVSDSNNCSVNKTITLTEPPPLIASANLNDYYGANIKCHGQTDTAFINASGGTGVYSLDYNGSQESFTSNTFIEGLAAGNYQVVIADSNQCSDTVSFQLQQHQPLNLLSPQTFDALCYGLPSGRVQFGVLGGVQSQGFQYLITSAQNNYSAQLFNRQAVDSVQGLMAGSYSLVAMDANQCVDSTFFTLNQPDTLSVVLQSSPVTCSDDENGTTAAQVLGGTSPYTFYWYNEFKELVSKSIAVDSLPSGRYQFFVEDDHHCFHHLTDTFPNGWVEVDAPDQSLDLTSDNIIQPSCFGQNDASFSVVASGGWQDYAFYLDGLLYASAPHFPGFTSGEYVAMVKDSLGCTDSTIVYITDPTPVVIDSVLTDSTFCASSADGAMFIYGSGGGGGFSYSIDGESWQQNQAFYSLENGSYNAFAKDANGCVVSHQVNIFSPEELGFRLTDKENSISCKPNGWLKIEAKGGTAPYTITWDNNAGNQHGTVASGLNTGIYYASITDANGCTKSVRVGTIDRADAPEVRLTNKRNTSCATTADGEIEITIEFDGTPHVTWLNDSPNFTLQQGLVATQLMPGIYTAQIQTEQECFNYFTDTVFAPPELTALLSATPLNCKGQPGGLAQVQIGGGVAPYHTTWITPYGDEIEDSLFVTGLLSGWHKVKINDASTCAGGADFVILDSVYVAEPEQSLEVFELGRNNILCHGEHTGFVKLGGSGGNGHYLFGKTPTAFTANTEFGGLSAGASTFYIKDIKGCIDSLEVVFTEPEPISSTFTLTTGISCFNENDGEVMVESTGGTYPYKYKMFETAPYSIVNHFRNLEATSYKVMVKDANSCKDTLEFTLQQPSPLFIDTVIKKDAWCSKPNGYIEIGLNGGTLPYTINWNDDLNQFGARAENLYEGSYRATLSDANGCVLQSWYSLTNFEPPQLQVNQTNDVSCYDYNNGEVWLSRTQGTAPFVYEWDGGSLHDTLSSVQLAPGPYQVRVSDKYNCSDTVAFSIEEPDMMQTDSVRIVPPHCSGAATGEAFIYTSGGMGQHSYHWNNNVITPLTIDLAQGKYFVTISDENGCEITDSVQMVDPDPLLINDIVKQDAWCGNPEGYLIARATGGTGALGYEWYKNNAFFGAGAQINQLAAGNYQLNITDSHGCHLDTAIQLVATAQPELSIANIVPTSCSYRNDGEIYLSVNNGGLPYVFNWGSKTTAEPKLTNLSAGTNYRVILEDAHHCRDTLFFDITEPDTLFMRLGEITDPTCYGFADGAISLIPQGGTAPYGYAWGSGKTDSLNTGLTKGRYKVTLTDANNCWSNESFVLHEPAPVEFSVSDSLYICGEQTVYASASPKNYTYNWWDSTTFVKFGHHVGLNAPGRYYIRATDYNGCEALDSIVVEGSDQEINANFLMQTEAYQGDTIVLVEISWPLPQEVAWDLPDAFEVLSYSDYELEVILTEEGTFSVGLTTVIDECSELATKQITVLPAEDRPAGYLKSGGQTVFTRVEVHPVPARGPVTLDVLLSETRDVQAQIADVNGVPLWQHQFKGCSEYVYQVDNLHVPTGVYTLRLTAGNEVKVKKLVIIGE